MWEAKSVPKTSFEDARAKAREARTACGYNPGMPEAGDGVDVEDGFPSDDDDVRENGGRDDASETLLQPLYLVFFCSFVVYFHLFLEGPFWPFVR